MKSFNSFGTTRPRRNINEIIVKGLNIFLLYEDRPIGTSVTLVGKVRRKKWSGHFEQGAIWA
jgi:hypothetical protein